jgi:RNA polymerase sigma-70 factor, ECF subfamily
VPRPPEDLIAFCRGEHARLTGMLALYCGDLDVAEDLVQETLARVCRDWKKVQKMDSPEAWAVRVATNLAHSHYRRRAAERWARKRAEALGVAGAPAWPPEPDELLDRVVRLPRRQRLAILMRYYLDMRVQDIATVLDCPAGTVKSLLHRAVRTLGREITLADSKEAPDAI